MTTDENDAAACKPRTYAQVQADELAAWDAVTPAEQTKRLLQNKAVHEAANAERAEREAHLQAHLARLNAATATLLALALEIEQASLDETADTDDAIDVAIEQDCAD